MSPELDDYLYQELRDLRDKVDAMDTRLIIMENTRALALKWGAGAGGAIATIVAVGHAIWSMI